VDVIVRGSLAVVVLSAACQLIAGTAASERAVQLGSEFILAPGEVVHATEIPSSTVRFQRVIGDRRCPRGMTCAISGPVTIAADVHAPPEAMRSVELSVLDREIGGPTWEGMTSCARFGKLGLQLRDVQPWPAHGAAVKGDAYRARFLLTRSCDTEARAR
jgi:hypothetical protein